MKPILYILFVLRLFPLVFAAYFALRRYRDYTGMLICMLYLCVTTVNFMYRNPSLNAIFSTPLVFLTAWYIIKMNRRLR